MYIQSLNISKYVLRKGSCHEPQQKTISVNEPQIHIHIWFYTWCFSVSYSVVSVQICIHDIYVSYLWYCCRSCLTLIGNSVVICVVYIWVISIHATFPCSVELTTAEQLHEGKLSPIHSTTLAYFFSNKSFLRDSLTADLAVHLTSSSKALLSHHDTTEL